MEYLFEDVLEIKNGRNQKNVENPEGQYPIYGSGGIMGYADDYICDADTVIIGRKGNINNPIYVQERFWNVDTAFGLHANRELLHPRYLYYFCTQYDFDRLNKTVTIPSLTKSDLLKIKIDVPELCIQQHVVSTLTKIESIIKHRQSKLKCLDTLIKARFVEMFGDNMENKRNFPIESLDVHANIVSGITKGRKTKKLNLTEVPYMAVSNVKDGYIDWTTVKTILATSSEIEQYRLQTNDVLMTEGGDPDKLGRGALLTKVPENCIHQNHIFRVRLDSRVNPVYFEEYLQTARPKRYFLKAAKQTTGIASINMTQLRHMPLILPPMEEQKEFADFVHRVDKSKFAVQKALDETQTLFNSLMQKYFG
ncbi:restriction endonuclease subunit S [Anaerovibrio sp.]|uniref:restriction endonuclease subunit S n=1 Tax=Anaerovibrio sp. TaxID=1872532 RepID=UPI0025BB4363|nr:restriction endonuclease subunit S [Anaerovibrio sp.]MBR2142258.1 restriction endonuclease subunit S [Anaerovibrio sp.]